MDLESSSENAVKTLTADAKPTGPLAVSPAAAAPPAVAVLVDPEKTVPPAAETLTTEWLDKKLQIAWELFQSVEGQVQVADRKVQAIFAANTLLVAAVSFQSQTQGANPHSGSLPAMLGLAVRLLLLACIGASSLSAIVALFPRLRGSAASGRTLLFFGDIAALPDEHFVESFIELPTADKVRQILRQTHTVSRLVAEKFKWTRRAGTALVLSLLLWIATQMVQLLLGA